MISKKLFNTFTVRQHLGFQIKVTEVCSQNSLAQDTGEMVRKGLICDFLQQ